MRSEECETFWLVHEGKKRPRGGNGVDDMARRRVRKNLHVGRSLDEFIQEQREKYPEFAAEFDRQMIARHVRALREKRKISQDQLAARVGTKQPAIARLESGRVVPKLDLLARVARALGKRLDVRFVESKESA